MRSFTSNDETRALFWRDARNGLASPIKSGPIVHLPSMALSGLGKPARIELIPTIDIGGRLFSYETTFLSINHDTSVTKNDIPRLDSGRYFFADRRNKPLQSMARLLLKYISFGQSKSHVHIEKYEKTGVNQSG